MKPTLLLVSSLNEISPANYLIDAFKLIGWNVVTVSDVKSKKADYVEPGSVDLGHLVKINDIDPHLILFVEGGEMGIFPVNFSDLGCPKFWWGIDTHNDYGKHLNTCKLFDHSFIAQKQFVKALERDGVASVSWLPLAYAATESSENLGPRELDIAYVGSTNWQVYPQRGELLTSIKKIYRNSFIGQCSPSEMFRKYEHSKIVFNFSPMNDLNMRFFEAIGSGALLLTNRVNENGVEEILNESEDYLIYDDKQDLLHKLDSILSDQESLKRISKNGQERIRTAHTYSHRVTEIIRHVDTVSRCEKVSNMTTSSVLLSMGLLSDSMQFYFLSIAENETGGKNKIIKSILSPVFRLIVLLANGLEALARNFKKIQ